MSRIETDRSARGVGIVEYTRAGRHRSSIMLQHEAEGTRSGRRYCEIGTAETAYGNDKNHSRDLCIGTAQVAGCSPSRDDSVMDITYLPSLMSPMIPNYSHFQTYRRWVVKEIHRRQAPPSPRFKTARNFPAGPQSPSRTASGWGPSAPRPGRSF